MAAELSVTMQNLKNIFSSRIPSLVWFDSTASTRQWLTRTSMWLCLPSRRLVRSDFGWMGLSSPRKLQGIQQCKDHFSSHWNFNLENDFFIHAIFVNNLRYIRVTAIQSLMDEFLELCRKEFDITGANPWKLHCSLAWI
jgi:hypothetical protein